MRLAAFTIRNGIAWKVRVASDFVSSIMDHHGHQGAGGWEIQPNGDIRVTILRVSYGPEFLAPTHNLVGNA